MEIVSKTTPRAVQISMPIPMGRGLVVARGRGQGGAGDFLNLDVDLRWIGAVGTDEPLSAWALWGRSKASGRRWR